MPSLITNKYLNLVLAFFAGIFFELSFAPRNIILFLFLAPMAFFYFIAQSASFRQSLFYGLAFGIGLFGKGVSWLFFSIYHYGNAGLVLSILITALVVFILALYFAFLSGLYYLGKKKVSAVIYYYLLLPGFWAFFEFLRSHLFTGFPWLLAAYPNLETPLIYYANFGGANGVYVVSFISILISSILFWGLESLFKKRYWLCFLNVFVAVIIFWSPHFFPKEKLEFSNSRQVTIIQGNIDQDIKWQSEKSFSILLYYDHLISQALVKNPDIIVLPEASIPYLNYEITDYLKGLQSKLRNKQTVILGLPIYDDENSHFYNGMLFMNRDKEQIYKKRHLVPLGEYMIFPKFFGFLMSLLHIPMSDFQKGPLSQGDFLASGEKIIPSICYEIAFPNLLKQDKAKAKFIINITDDSWFGPTDASSQQLEIARFMSYLFHKYQIISANTGISAVIDSSGHIVAKTSLNKGEFLESRVFY